MLPIWKKRPEVTANLLNPAFCSEIMRECIAAYTAEINKNFPFVLSVLILPLILNRRIRERLPKSKANNIHNWINNNEDLKVGLAKSISNLIPFTKETLMFSIAYDSLTIDKSGNIESKTRKRKLKVDDIEIKSSLNKAAILGKLLSKSGNPSTIYSILGVRP